MTIAVPRVTLIYLFLVVFPFLSVKGQLVADFEADTTSFCPPYVVNFKDISTGGLITSRNWTFGPSQSSTGNNAFPTVSYTTPGVYNVTLTVSDGSRTASVTKTAFIEVFSNPTAKFVSTTARSGCAPIGVSFADSSKVGSAPISSWTWNFGNGTTSNQQNPSHNYGFGGQYSVSLNVIDTNGCVGNVRKPAFVQANFKPKAQFSSSNPHHCKAPHVVNYTNTTKGTYPMTFAWSFGDGTSSAQENPIKTYATGIFDVRLIVIDRNGCRDTIRKPAYASVTNTLANFSLSDTICQSDSVQLQNLSVGGSGYTWTFGDGSGSSLRDPVKVYAAKGLYTIKLLTATSQTCIDSISKSIYVDKPEAKFSAAPNYNCEDLLVRYSDSSSVNVVKWTWNFGNRSSSTQQNPTNYFSTSGVFNDTLVVETNFGCRDTLISPGNVRLDKLQAAFLPDSVEGCAPLSVTFMDVSTKYDSIASWSWDFGNGQTSTLRNPNVTFLTAGTYIVQLTIQSKNGNCSSSVSKQIVVGARQNASFVIDTTINCAYNGFNFKSTATDSNLITEWLWAFSDGGSGSGKNFYYRPQDTGWISVSHIVEYNGCYDTLAQTNVFRSLGPIGTFNISYDCNDPFVVGYTPNNWIDYDRFVYDFGVYGAKDSLNMSPSYTYPSRGLYPAGLTLYNDSNGCEMPSGKVVKILVVQAVVSTDDTLLCAPSEALFTAKGTQDANSLNYRFLATDTFGNDFWMKLPVPVKGKHIMMLIATDEHNCSDTAFVSVKAFKPEANFTLDTNQACAPVVIHYMDSTVSDTTLRSWDWYPLAGVNSNKQNDSISYRKKGSYTIELQVEDVLGCRDTFRKINVVEVYQPDLSVIPDSQLCVGDTLFYQNFAHDSGYTYQWSFGSTGSFDTTASIVYNVSGKHDWFVTVTDHHGCDSVAEGIQYVDVQDIPSAGFFSNLVDTSCYPAEVILVDTTNDSNVVIKRWDFGTGDPAFVNNSDTIRFLYTYPGKFDVKLYVETSYGCADSVAFEQFIDIKGPWSELAVEEDTICTGESFEILPDSTFQIFKIFWDYGDGNIDTVNAPFAGSHAYTSPGTFLLRMLYNDSSGNCVLFKDDSLYVFQVISSFDLDTLQGCEPLEVNTSNFSRGAQQYTWINQGDSTYADSTSFSFNKFGNYIVQLISKDSISGCADTSGKAVQVFAIPEVRIASDTIICLGDELNLVGLGAKSYEWSPSVVLNRDTGRFVNAAIELDTRFELKGTSAQGCEAEDFIDVFVQYPVEFAVNEDTTIFVGQSTDIELFSNDSLVLKWSPSTNINCDTCRLSRAEPFETTTYIAEVIDLNGCFVKFDSVTIYVRDDWDVHIPNAFTPNFDGLNDEFFIVSYGLEKLNFLRVYDRWGALVFETKDLNGRWNGEGRKETWDNSNTFVYELEAERFNGQIVNLVGTLNLIK